MLGVYLFVCFVAARLRKAVCGSFWIELIWQRDFCVFEKSGFIGGTLRGYFNSIVVKKKLGERYSLNFKL